MKKNFIPYGRQSVSSEDIRAVSRVLRSDFLTQGPVVEKFEKCLCAYTGARYAAAVSSGTAALHLAVKALNLPGGFEAVTSPVSFVATANSVIYNQGRPVFADILPDTYTLDPAEAEKKFTERTRLLMPVDLAGHPAEHKTLYEVAKKRGASVILDAAHSLGAAVNNKKTGSCEYADMTVLSFHPVKHITTGEGGAVLTNSRELYEKIRLLRSHGITRDPERMSKNEGMWYYEMTDLGYNYRLTDFQSALGISQMKKLDRFVKRRRRIAFMYNDAFRELPGVIVPEEKRGGVSSWHLYVLLIDFEKKNKSRQEVMTCLKKEKILTQVHYIPIHLQPYYQKNFGYREGDFPNAEDYYGKCLSLPLYPALADKDVEYVIRRVKEVLA